MSTLTHLLCTPADRLALSTRLRKVLPKDLALIDFSPALPVGQPIKRMVSRLHRILNKNLAQQQSSFSPTNSLHRFTIARMSPEKLLALALDPFLILQARGLPPDPWQRELLLSSERQVLLNCSRQSGKSTPGRA